MNGYDDFVLTDLISANTLQRIQDGFSKYTGIAALTTDANGTPVTEGSGFTNFCFNIIRTTELGCQRCHECDKMGALSTLENERPVSYHCHSGLVDFAAPIMVEGRFLGSFVGGQVRTGDVPEDKLRAIAAELGIDGELYLEEFRKVRLVEEEQVQKTAEFLSELAGAISDMAYKNYNALRKSRKLERVARSQTSFMVEMNNNMRRNVQEWIHTANQLSGVLGNQVLQDTFDELKQKGDDFLKSVEESIEYAKITDGDTELNEVFYEPRRLLGSIAEKAQNSCSNTAVRFDVRVEESVPKVLLGDEGRIAQILNKLIQNALLHTQSGVIEIRASCSTKSYSHLLKLEVCDTGWGLSEQSLNQLKEKLENSVISFERDNIGITIICMLANMMSGKVSVESADGHGTRFTVVIPQIAVAE